ncbi:UDP-glycosyltransferase 75C1-like [Hibiscus syriacus]|uniref:UDP-glycosyltransferase 75C1-like n=1 Tax=Hibiscus syriacus TaxID=106335 RepID=UPI0019235ECE|nr:UDP-glycosyltransferase 75C1-like [Hibiscus syriacus]
MEVLAKKPNARILVNTFDALEPEALNAIEKFKMIVVGPLIQSSLDSSLRVDIFQCNSNDYLQWLNSKPKSSVVYVSFESIVVLARKLGEKKKPNKITELQRRIREVRDDSPMVFTSGSFVSSIVGLLRDSLRVELDVGELGRRCADGSVPSVF